MCRAESHRKADGRFCTQLCQKGISKEIAVQAVDACFEKADETEAILKIIAKKRVDPDAAPEQLHKLYGYLARKGFRYEDIRQVIQNYEENA